MNKPISTLRMELVQRINAAINAAANEGLPHCVIADVVCAFSVDARANANAEYQRDHERYLAALKAAEQTETKGE